MNTRILAVGIALSFFGCSVVTASTTTKAEIPNGEDATATHPIEYHIGCSPEMVLDGSLDYFKAHGFSTVHMVARDERP